MKMYRYKMLNFFSNPRGHYGRGIERAKIEIISRKASHVGRKLYRAARSKVTGDAAQYHDFAACELVTEVSCVCMHALACWATLATRLWWRVGGAHLIHTEKIIRWFPGSQSDERDTWHLKPKTEKLIAFEFLAPGGGGLGQSHIAAS
jgi:hypothetical protein